MTNIIPQKTTKKAPGSTSGSDFPTSTDFEIISEVDNNFNNNLLNGNKSSNKNKNASSSTSSVDKVIKNSFYEVGDSTNSTLPITEDNNKKSRSPSAQRLRARGNTNKDTEGEKNKFFSHRRHQVEGRIERRKELEAAKNGNSTSSSTSQNPNGNNNNSPSNNREGTRSRNKPASVTSNLIKRRKINKDLQAQLDKREVERFRQVIGREFDDILSDDEEVDYFNSPEELRLAGRTPGDRRPLTEADYERIYSPPDTICINCVFLSLSVAVICFAYGLLFYGHDPNFNRWKNLGWDDIKIPGSEGIEFGRTMR